MTMREKIIIGVMALAVLYGVLEFFLLAPARKARMEAENRQQDLNTFVAGLTKEMAEKNISGTDRYILERATAPWKQDLFFDAPPDVLAKTGAATGESETAEEVPFTYSGYMEMGRKRTAIISGLEYVQGDELRDGEYLVRAIFPNRVILERKEGKVEIILPLEEGKL